MGVLFVNYEILELEQQLIQFGERIKQIRVERGLSMDVVAKDTGVTKSYLSRLERGLRDNPSFLVVFILADYFDIPLESILTVNKVTA